MDDEILLFERRGEVGMLTLNRPDQMNTLNQDMLRQLLDRLEQLEADFETRVLVVTGAGRMFCAGADLKAPPKPWRQDVGKVASMMANADAFGEVVRRMRRIPQPIIAAVNGAAAGGGFALAFAADMRLASPAARFACSFGQAGLTGAEMGSSFFLHHLIGPANAADLMYTARVVESEEALTMGLVSRVVPADRLLDESLELAESMITKLTPFALRMTKEALTENVNGLSLDAALKLEGRQQILASHTEDQVEARAAFAEKRRPVWRDR